MMSLLLAGDDASQKRENHTGLQPITTVDGLPLALDGLSQASINRDNAETARAVAAEELGMEVASRPVQRAMFHRSTSDKRAVGYDRNSNMLVPYDNRGYAKVAPAMMFHRGPGESTALRLIDAVGNEVKLDSAGRSSAGYPACEAVFSADAIDINIHQAGATYVQWRMRRVTFPARVADVWRILGVFEATRTGSGAYTAGQELFNNGEIEMAIAIQGKAELIGGTTHGGEMLTDFYVLLDGARIDHTLAGVRECSRIEMFQRANMFEPSATGGDAWPAGQPQVGTNARRWQFDRDGLTLGNHVEWSKTGFGILHSYFGMAPMRRANGGVQITDTAARAPIWQPVDVTAAGGPDVFSKADHVKVWGSRSALDAKATRGWDRPVRNMRVWNADAYNKVYFDFHGGEGAAVGDTTAVGTTWDVENRINITIKEGTS